MNTHIQIVFMRVKRIARHHISRAVDLLLGIGATLAQACRFVALCRSQVMA